MHGHTGHLGVFAIELESMERICYSRTLLELYRRPDLVLVLVFMCGSYDNAMCACHDPYHLKACLLSTASASIVCIVLL